MIKLISSPGLSNTFWYLSIIIRNELLEIKIIGIKKVRRKYFADSPTFFHSLKLKKLKLKLIPLPEKLKRKWGLIPDLNYCKST